MHEPQIQVSCSGDSSPSRGHPLVYFYVVPGKPTFCSYCRRLLSPESS